MTSQICYPSTKNDLVRSEFVAPAVTHRQTDVLIITSGLTGPLRTKNNKWFKHLTKQTETHVSERSSVH